MSLNSQVFPKIGFIHVDLKPLITTRLNGRRELLEKHSHRERSRCRDVERKIAVQLTRLFPDAMHGFERLNKENVIRRDRSSSKKLRKRIARVSWRNIVREVGQRAIIEEVDPKDTSKSFSRPAPDAGLKLET